MSTRIIQVRPSRDMRWKKLRGWEVFEAEGVCPVYCGTNGRDSALSYRSLPPPVADLCLVGAASGLAASIG
jgi:hypothetical protein